MADTASVLRFPAEEKLLSDTAGLFSEIAGSIGKFFHRRWIYRDTISKLHGYSHRDLLDIGADRGVEEFARRAAGL